MSEIPLEGLWSKWRVSLLDDSTSSVGAKLCLCRLSCSRYIWLSLLSFSRSLSRSLVLSLSRSFALSPSRFLARSLSRSLALSLSLACSLVVSLARSLVLSLARSHSCSRSRSVSQQFVDTGSFSARNSTVLVPHTQHVNIYKVNLSNVERGSCL